MAVLKFGSIVTEGSGSLGGHTIQHSKGGMQIRTKPLPHGNPSASQRLIRSLNQQMQAGWRALTSSQQKIWNDWPATHGIFNAKGDKHPLSGHSLWMKWQFTRLYESLPFLSSPDLHLDTYIGPELLNPLNFYNWSVAGGGVIDSAVSCHSIGIGGPRKYLLNDPGYYRLTANILSLTGDFRYADDSPLRFLLFNLTIGYTMRDFLRMNSVPSLLYIRNYSGISNAYVTYEYLSLKKIYNY